MTVIREAIGLRRGSAHQQDAPVLQVTDLAVQYNGSPALEGISFSLRAGEQVAVVGPNGAGKSTLFKAIAGILRPSRGHIAIAGSAPGEHICIAYVPQRTQVDWHFPANVADVVMMGRAGKIGFFRRPSSSDWTFVRHCLTEVGMSEFATRQIGELSGGQQQRVFIARALAQEAELMLMDEPLTGLDLSSQEDIFVILDVLRQRQVTVMVATHDLDMAAERFDSAMLLNRKLLGFGRSADVFTPPALLAAYGGRLRLVETPEGLVAIGDTCCEGGEP